MRYFNFTHNNKQQSEMQSIAINKGGNKNVREEQLGH